MGLIDIIKPLSTVLSSTVNKSLKKKTQQEIKTKQSFLLSLCSVAFLSLTTKLIYKKQKTTFYANLRYLIMIAFLLLLSLINTKK